MDYCSLDKTGQCFLVYMSMVSNPLEQPSAKRVKDDAPFILMLQSSSAQRLIQLSMKIYSNKTCSILFNLRFPNLLATEPYFNISTLTTQGTHFQEG